MLVTVLWAGVLALSFTTRPKLLAVSLCRRRLAHSAQLLWPRVDCSISACSRGLTLKCKVIGKLFFLDWMKH